MLATRFNTGNTGSNLAGLLRLVNDKNCKDITLYASPTSADQGASESDGPEANFPLVAALARYEIPGITDVYVVFDGLLLTASRRSRFLEVVQLMDACQASGKTKFGQARAPFTSALEPTAAVSALQESGPTLDFTSSTRSRYFALLSNIAEADYP